MPKKRVQEICIFTNVSIYLNRANNLFKSEHYMLSIAQLKKAIIGFSDCALKGLLCSKKTIIYYEYIKNLEILLARLIPHFEDPVFEPALEQVILILTNYTNALENATDYDYNSTNDMDLLDSRQFHEEQISLRKADVHLEEIQILFESLRVTTTYFNSAKIFPFTPDMDDKKLPIRPVSATICESLYIMGNRRNSKKVMPTASTFVEKLTSKNSFLEVVAEEGTPTIMARDVGRRVLPTLSQSFSGIGSSGSFLKKISTDSIYSAPNNISTRKVVPLSEISDEESFRKSYLDKVLRDSAGQKIKHSLHKQQSKIDSFRVM